MQNAVRASSRQSLVRSFRRCTIGYHRQHSRSFPWRESADPYSVLIGEILLQRTRAEHVTEVFAAVPEEMAEP